MNSSQNEIVEKLIGGDANHGFGSFTETEIYNLTNISPTSTVLGLINKFCKAKSKKDIEAINKRISDWKGPNLHWQNKIRKILNKIRHAYRDQLPPNIRISKTTIQWKEEGDTSIDNAHELSMEEEETKTPQAPIESSKQTDKDKDVDLKDKVPKYVPNKETSKPVDTSKSPTESSKSPDETDEKGEKDKDIELEREKNMEESAKKPITEEEEKKIKEFQAKHNKNLKDSALKDIIEDRRTKDAYYYAESEYGPEVASVMVPEIANIPDIKPLTDEEKDKVKKGLKEHNADVIHDNNLRKKVLNAMYVPFDKEKFEHNLDGIQMSVNHIKQYAIKDRKTITDTIGKYLTYGFSESDYTINSYNLSMDGTNFKINGNNYHMTH